VLCRRDALSFADLGNSKLVSRAMGDTNVESLAACLGSVLDPPRQNQVFWPWVALVYLIGITNSCPNIVPTSNYRFNGYQVCPQCLQHHGNFVVVSFTAQNRLQAGHRCFSQTKETMPETRLPTTAKQMPMNRGSPAYLGFPDR